MAAIAESPPVRYSIEDADHSSTQPRPVVVISASTRGRSPGPAQLGDDGVGDLVDRPAADSPA